MFKIILWKGTHSLKVQELIEETQLRDDQLLILCPPRIENVDDYLPFLPEGRVEFSGDFKDRTGFDHKSSEEYSILPSFGLFSTGTSDKSAKLVLFTKENIESSNKGILSFFKELPVKTLFCYPQPYHIFGLSLGHLLGLQEDFELVTPKGAYGKDHHKEFLSCAAKYGEGLMTLSTPTHMLDLISYCQRNSIEVPKSLTCVLGGAKVSIDLWKQSRELLKIKYPSIGYGCTEASPGVTHLPPGVMPKRNGDLGFALPELEITTFEDCIEIKGKNICHAIIQEGKISFPKSVYQMNDILLKNSDESYSFSKRSDLILNRGGEKFSLEEIESYLLKEMAMDVVALPVTDLRLGHDLALVVKGSENNKKKISELLFDKYQRKFSLDHIKIIDSLPINSNAKIDRLRCAKYFEGIE